MIKAAVKTESSVFAAVWVWGRIRDVHKSERGKEMKRRNRLISMLLTAALAFAVPAYGIQAEESTENHVSMLRVGTQSGQTTFSAANSGSAFGRMNYNSFTQANLLQRDENGDIQPAFFQSWEFNEDATEMTFTYPTNAFWHDGEPVTYDDIEFTLFKLNELYNYGIEKVELIEEGTGKISFAAPVGIYYLNRMTITAPLLAKHVWEGQDVDTYNGEDAAIGCGPYKFVSYDQDAQISYYEAVDNYYGGEVTVDQVSVKTYSGQEALVMALANNEIDCIYDYSNPVDVSLVETLLDDSSIDVGASDNIGTYYMTFGCGSAPFDNADFRGAIINAIDYTITAEVVNGSYGLVPSIGMIPPSNLGYDPELPAMEQNSELSNQLLDELGYADVDGDGYRETPEGEQMDLMVTVQSSVRPEMFMRLYDVVSQDLAAVGIRTHIDEESLNNSDVLRERAQSGEYEIYMGICTSGAAPIQSVYMYVLQSSRLPAGTCPGDEINEYYQKALAATTAEEYEECMKKVQELNASVYAGAALCWDKTFFPYRTDTMTGWTNFPAWGVINYKTWTNTVLK